MSPSRTLITLAAIVVSLLVVIDVAFRYREYAFTRQFRIANVRTNDANAIMILDGKTGKPLWGKWDLGFGGNPDTISFFFEGRNIMNVYPAGKSPGFDITFFGPDGRVRAIWVSKGTNAGFTVRVVYEGVPRKEVWFNEAWHTLHYRTNSGAVQGGIIFDGAWRHVTFTNGAVTLDPAP